MFILCLMYLRWLKYPHLRVWVLIMKCLLRGFSANFEAARLKFQGIFILGFFPCFSGFQQSRQKGLALGICTLEPVPSVTCSEV